MEYKLNTPYPSLKELDINQYYGQIMLSNLGGIHSEMSAVSLYIYNYVVLSKEWPELSHAMMAISIVEMHHLDIFAQMCFHLGVDPRLWDCQNEYLEYWSPGYNIYPRQIHTMLENAIIQEQETISIYEQQILCIDEPIIQNMLRRIIEDEKLHIEILQYFLNEYLNKN